MKNLAVLCLLVAAQAGAQVYPDTIYFNGKVITVSEALPAAQAFAVSGNRFASVGANQAVLATAGPKTRKVDLKGRMVTPGLIEAHTHPVMAAMSERDVPVPVMRTIPEIQEFIRQEVRRLPPDRMIFVPKVYPSRLKERRYPTRYELDAVSGDRLAMTDNSYASVLNSAMLKKLGITRDTPQPDNGKIIKDERGEPTGLVVGAAHILGPLRRSRPQTYEDTLWAIRSMQKAYNAVGITSTLDRGQGAEGVRAYQDLRRQDALTVRTNVTYMIGLRGGPKEVDEEMTRIPLLTGMGDDWVRIGPIKTVVDGGILLGTAYMREPWGEHTQIYGYVDPDYRGVLSVSKENLVQMARTANRLGWQMTAHVAGGGAVDVLLDAYEAADRDRPIRDRRFTITHGNFANAASIERSKRLGVLWDCQIAWHHIDGPALQTAFGPERMKQFVPFRTMIDAGLLIAGGSDHMIRFHPRNAINPYHPFYGMWMAITRKGVDGVPLTPRERITRMEALKMWTINGAYMAFEEKQKGSIEPGKLADFAVITKDYLNCPEDELQDIEAVATVVDGKLVYGKLD
jgi:predicted amidohydrolase YtcJ